MTDSNYVYNKGDILVAPGGGGAPQILPVGPDGSQLVANSTATNGLGLDYQAAGSNITSGTFTFAAGTHAQIPLADVTADSVIVYTIKTLGTVTVAQAISTALAAGVGFTPTSAGATDTSVVNWALVKA